MTDADPLLHSEKGHYDDKEEPRYNAGIYPNPLVLVRHQESETFDEGGSVEFTGIEVYDADDLSYRDYHQLKNSDDHDVRTLYPGENQHEALEELWEAAEEVE